MTFLQAIMLGIVEGLTEFLPVSSTGHLLLTNTLLGLDGPAADSYTIVIQLGAILAVMLYYRDRLFQVAREGAKAGTAGRRLMVNLIIAFMPAAVIGLMFDDFIEEKLMTSDLWIAAALVVGGVVMIVVEKWKKPESGTVTEVDQVTPKQALLVGFAQCFALWPGMSRSMSTIVGAQLLGFRNSVAADFSFLLAIPTLGAATLYKLVKDWEILTQMEGGLIAILVGLVTSFIVALAAIAWFLKVLKKIGMTPFGIYRIVVGGILILILL